MKGSLRSCAEVLGGGENTEKGLRENHHTSRTEGIGEGGETSYPKNSWKKIAGLSA